MCCPFHQSHHTSLYSYHIYSYIHMHPSRHITSYNIAPCFFFCPDVEVPVTFSVNYRWLGLLLCYYALLISYFGHCESTASTWVWWLGHSKGCQQKTHLIEILIGTYRFRCEFMWQLQYTILHLRHVWTRNKGNIILIRNCQFHVFIIVKISSQHKPIPVTVLTINFSQGITSGYFSISHILPTFSIFL